jgi:hypothetical protein
VFEIEPINLTALISALLGGFSAILLAWAKLRQLAVAAVETAYRDKLTEREKLLEAHEQRLNAQAVRLDEQARINALQEQALQEQSAAIEVLTKKLDRYRGALGSFSKALQRLDPHHAYALQQEYADLMDASDANS